MTPSLTEAVARALAMNAHGAKADLEATVDLIGGAPVALWRVYLPVAEVAIKARDAWVAENAPFDGGAVTQSRLRKLRKIAARPGAGE